MIDNLFTDFFEQCGDRQCKEDAAILCGIARFHGMPVTVLGHRKGTTLEENLRCNFGMPGPEGYRKALRVMKQAEKFRRPIITFIDTPGAYPGKENGADGAHGIIEHSEQKADAERMQKDGYLAVQPLDILHQRNTRLKNPPFPGCSSE